MRDALLMLCMLAAPVGARAQAVPTDLARERDEYARWLASAPTSPNAAEALLPVGTGITLGEGEADVVLPGIPRTSISETRGALTLSSGKAKQPLARGRLTSVGGPYRVLASGAPGRTTVTVFGPVRKATPPTYYPYATDAALRVKLTPPRALTTLRLLGPDGTELQAAEAGMAEGTWHGRPLRLTVRRLPGATEDESELQVFFRDGTSARGSYDGGRFVELLPQKDGTYLLDFNRARNPFCAYSSVFPCPAPWPGNLLDMQVPAGERYDRKPAAPGA